MVFIHGLGGDAHATWRHGKDDSTSWPHWLGEQFPDVGVWSLGYAASPSAWPRILAPFSQRWRDAGHTMSLPDRAVQVLNLMELGGLGERPLFFICHSLGGLLAKQILRASSDAQGTAAGRIFANTRAVLFLATPHAGAELASLADAFRELFGTTVTMEDLRAHDAHLRELFNWYRNHAVAPAIQTATYYEGRTLRGLTIVNPTSAHPGVGADPVMLDEDHLSIAKPRNRDAQVCSAAGRLLRTCVLSPKAASTAIPPPPVSPAPLPVLTVNVQTDAQLRSSSVLIPHELPPAAEKFFGRDDELERLIGRLRNCKNTAVVGAAGLGKTALAAEALRAVVGDTPATLAASSFLDGVVFLDLYAFHGEAEPAWETLANKAAGAGFLERSPARTRATDACRARRLLVVIEGGEEADGRNGHANIGDILSVLSPQNRWLLLTRLSTQSADSESVRLKEALLPEDAASLLDSLTEGHVTAALRDRALKLLDGHPLALTWAGNLLARDDDDPARLITDWESAGLPQLSDPRQATHTLEWLFNRSVRSLDDTSRQALAAAALLARAPFPLAAIDAALGDSGPDASGTPAISNSSFAAKVGQALPPANLSHGLSSLKSLVQCGLLRRSDDPDHWQFAHVLAYRFARKETGSDPAIRRRLGHWLQGHLAAALETGAEGDGPLSLTRALEHLDALLRADDDQALWNPLANFALYDVRDRLTALGRLTLVKLALGAVETWMVRIPADRARERYWLRERSVLGNLQGDVLSDQGDLAGALAAYGKSLEVGRRLAEADPSNAGWQRDLSVSHNKIGDVLSAQGDLAGALAAYGKSLEVSRRLAEADPSNAGWQGDLSVSHNKIGDVLSAQGDLAGALAAYGKSLEVRRRLAEADPSNAGWQRDLSVSHSKIGDVLSAQGDLAGALAAYGKSLEVSRRLAESDPSNAGWQRDLSVSHEKIGDVLSAQGDLAGALAAYGKSLEVSRRLAEADPSNAGWQRDLSVSHNKIGDVLRDQGDLAGALAAYGKSLEVSRRLAEADPSNAGWQRDLSVSYEKIGDVLSDQGDLAGALAAYGKSLEVRRRLAEADPSNAGWQRDLSFSLTLIAQLHERQSESVEALRFAIESLTIDERLAALDRTNVTWQNDVAVSRALVARLRSASKA